MAKRDFIFHFESGGFNTVMAETLEQARELVVSEWGDNPKLKPRLNTVREVSQKELDSWYRLFD